MSRHPAGPGRILLNNAAPVGGVRAVLSNFDIDSHTLKPEHTTFLETRVVPILSSRRSRIWMQGSASSTGTEAHNPLSNSPSRRARGRSRRVRCRAAVLSDLGSGPQHHELYIYTSGGLGRGDLAISTTLEGPWNDFGTTGPVAVDEFGGAARFTTAGAGPYTYNYLNMMSMPRGAATTPNPLSLSTGFTVGIGATSTGGNMQLGPTLPFSGP